MQYYNSITRWTCHCLRIIKPRLYALRRWLNVIKTTIRDYVIRFTHFVLLKKNTRNMNIWNLLRMPDKIVEFMHENVSVARE